MKWMICLLLLLLNFLAQSQNIAIELNTNWRFRKLSDKNWLEAKVPGAVYTDLIENKKIIENILSIQDYNIIKIQLNQIQCSRLMNETNVRIFAQY